MRKTLALSLGALALAGASVAAPERAEAAVGEAGATAAYVLGALAVVVIAAVAISGGDDDQPPVSA
ncbi:hypothetical protein CHH26_13000 [Qipengyuania flava]|uniref:hypothetical protein n=1 Tax=Qipengyuania flava TaxID=192812 RepID=UPI000B8C5ECA|nr:hypothetical protein [Qipengyuania flava]ASP31040.1 hypothetical protein CHH26_13000 [Qipengyuania flava]